VAGLRPRHYRNPCPKKIKDETRKKWNNFQNASVLSYL
jgi:hypothetical protein